MGQIQNSQMNQHIQMNQVPMMMPHIDGSQQNIHGGTLRLYLHIYVNHA